jgi:hypothetical protein
VPDQYVGEEIRIYSTTGQLMKTLRMSDDLNNEVILDLPAGLYIIHLKEIQSKILIEK